MNDMPDHIRAEVQRILDSAARRILAERQRKTLNTPTGGDSDLGNQANDQGTALVNIGDHVTNRKVQGGRYRVHEVTADHLVVRDVKTAVPALIDRSDLDRWRIVWKCERGHEGLTPDPPGLVRVDRARACGGRG